MLPGNIVRRIFLLWLVLGFMPALALQNSGDVAQPQYTRRVWKVQDGLPEDTVQGLAQTSDGYLWIGTTGGLTRFDGTRFVLYGLNAPHSPGVNSVFCLEPSRDGGLWIGTEGGGLLHLLKGQVRSYGAAEGLTDGFVRSVLEDRHGVVWVGTDNGLFQVKGGKVERVEMAEGIGPLAVHVISEDRESRIWVGGSRLLSITDGRQLFYGLPGSYSSNRVKTVLQTKDGTVWVGTVSGLERLVGQKFERVPEVAGTVRTMKQTSDGTLWIGTIGNGLWTYKDGVFSRLQSLLPGNTVLKIFEDDSRQVWLGLQDGLVRLSRTPVREVPLPGGSDADFETISGNGDSSLWVVASAVYTIRDGVARPYRFNELPNVMVRNVFRDRGGDLWVGTDGSGVYRITTRGVIHYSAPHELTNNFIRAFLESRRGEMWIATDEGVSRLTAQGVQRFNMKDGLVYFSTRSLFEDNTGDIWIGTDQGLSQWHQGTFVHDAVTEALRHEKVWSIYEDLTHTLWFGTRDHGLFRYQGGRMAQFTTAQGLASNSIYQILEDPQRRFWLSGPNTISSLDERQMHEEVIANEHLSVSLYTMPYGAEDAQMYGGRQPSGYLDPNGSVWFPSNKGAMHIQLEDPVTPAVPRLVLEGITLDGRNLPLDGTIRLPSEMKRLEFHYASLSLRPQEGIRYQYRLEGFDKDWVYAGTSLTASYTNLPAGKYRFHVAVFDVANPALTTETSVGVEREQVVWLTWWFLTLCLAALMLAAFGIYRLRMHQVRLRFRAVLDERGRLAREMHDTLIQGCTSVSALLEGVASLQMKNHELQEDLLRHARAQVRTTIDEARHAVWDLRHEEGTALELSASVKAIAAQTTMEFGVAVNCVVEGEAYSVPGAILRELLMVVREAVYNAVLHGRARQIDIQVCYELDRLAVNVTDDGVGFDTTKTPAEGHYGIVGMRERVERVGGVFGLRSAPHSGTKVELAVERAVLHSKAVQARRWAMG
ncbi:sensor histidine kinase [Granulicella sp. L60]|uniref:sensor histidine kinase n=1 Tax=Granulicella sp. L60 TaxID=1641866 RepID=UPI00131BF87A|nr:sensor histidine kinase [Granulicella sp. L60]